MDNKLLLLISQVFLICGHEYVSSHCKACTINMSISTNNFYENVYVVCHY